LEIHRFTIDCEGELVRLVPLGDIHRGHKNCDWAKLIEIIEWIKRDPKCFWIGMGDYGDSIVPSHDEKRWDYAEVDVNCMIPDQQYGEIYEQFEKIKDRCIGLHVGNHDDVLRKRHFHDYVIEDLCKPLGVKYLGWEAFTHLQMMNTRWKQRTAGHDKRGLTIFSTHGYYSGRRLGGATNRLEDIADDYIADIYLMGHIHHLQGWRKIQLGLQHNPTSTKIREYKKAYVLTGGFLRGHQVGTTSYIEKKNLEPSKIGIAVIEIDPYRYDIHISE